MGETRSCFPPAPFTARETPVRQRQESAPSARTRPVAASTARAYHVALALAVAQPLDLCAEDLREVLVLGEVGEDPLGRLLEAELDVDVVGAHARQLTLR